jgi:Cu-processing system permease protein
MPSPERIWIIALNTFREAVRDRVLYNILFLAVGLALFSVMLGEWSVFDRTFVIKSVTLTVMSLSGLLISVFAGIGLVQKEIQRRTVLTLLAKPLYRGEFLVGKYLGLLAVVAVHVTLLSCVLGLILLWTGTSPDWTLLQAVYLVFWEMALVLAMAVLFSTFSSPLLSALFTLGLYVAGHMSHQILEQMRFAYRMSYEGTLTHDYAGVLWNAAKVLHWVLPGLYRFNVSSQVVHGLALSPSYMAWNTLYAMGFVALFLAIAGWWFGRRDFL